MQLSGSFRRFWYRNNALQVATLALFLAPLASAQQPMPGMQMGASGQMNMQPENFIQEIMAHTTSGTSAEPDSTPMPMLMTTKHLWTLMFHANVFILDEQQSSARGGDKFFSTNWFMGMAKHKAGPGVLTIRSMLTLEPATITAAPLSPAVSAR